jgi:hypothetical protein
MRAFGALSSVLIFFFSVIIFFLITGCATQMHQRSERQATDNARRAQTSAPSVLLFVHLIAPRYYTDPSTPPKRVATTRISIGEDFAVSFGDSNLYSYSVGGPEPYSYSGDAVLAGRIEQRGARLFANLLGVSGSLNVFAGEIEIEKPVWSQGVSIGGIGLQLRFVLSTNSDCNPFLKEHM